MQDRTVFLACLCIGLGVGAMSGCSGEDGLDAVPCSVERNEDAGRTTINCPGAAPVVITDGEDGQNGEDGQTCAIERDNDAGTTTITCPGSEPVVITDGTDGTNGEDGTSCTATDNGDGSITISCEDGTEVVVRDGEDGQDGVDGEDGQDGQDGTRCSVLDNLDGTFTLSCDDGTEVVISDGVDGEDGEDGQDGNNCTVADNEDGTFTLSCEDGTEVVISDGVDGENGEDGTGCTVTDNPGGTITISCEDGTEATFRDNSPPSAPTLVIDPPDPAPGQPLNCLVEAPSVDPDGDEVSVAFAWLLDGEPTEFTGPQLPGGQTQADQSWQCVGTPTDGADEGQPGSSPVVNVVERCAPGVVYNAPAEDIFSCFGPAVLDLVTLCDQRTCSSTNQTGCETSYQLVDVAVLDVREDQIDLRARTTGLTPEDDFFDARVNFGNAMCIVRFDPPEFVESQAVANIIRQNGQITIDVPPENVQVGITANDITIEGVTPQDAFICNSITPEQLIGLIGPGIFFELGREMGRAIEANFSDELAQCGELEVP